MALKTPLTELLGIEHPVILAPMDIVSGGALAAAVSHAGGLGMIGGGYGEEDWLRRELRTAGNARIGVGFITWSLDRDPMLLDMVLDAAPAAVMLSFGDVSSHAGRIKATGATLVCQVHTVRDAEEVAEHGADVVVAQGTEAGGHGQRRSTFPLVPAIVDALGDRVPVVAAGGIADGRGLAAALMLGASGVLMGTRFYASREALGHPLAKQRIVEALGDETQRSSDFDVARDVRWPTGFTGRTLENAFSSRWRDDLQALQSDSDTERTRYRKARDEGDFDVAAVIAGESVDLISSVEPASDIVASIVADAEGLLAGASDRYLKH